MFILDNVEKHYGNVSVLKNISCQIPIDGFVVVMGPSGSGKSTLLRLLSFVETPDHGNVRLTLNGQEFESIKPTRPWPRVTCVFQKQFLWPHLTLRENIRLPLHAAGVHELESKLKSVINLFGMSAFVDRFPNEVSGGQAQRAALARALVLDPQLILIDEAHGGLDLEQQKILNDYLIKLRESGVALIIVTHSLEFARRYADRVVIVEDGTVTDVGTRDILERPRSPYLRRAIGLSTPRGQ
ncbi:MAG: ATP-binding cassette domain-containing protein [Deltaproteobacteria bacterium]|nr:ATP-binding cassette domain-containing protein [Deltaproteobacteria bacterium]